MWEEFCKNYWNIGPYWDDCPSNPVYHIRDWLILPLFAAGGTELGVGSSTPSSSEDSSKELLFISSAINPPAPAFAPARLGAPLVLSAAKRGEVKVAFCQKIGT